MKTKSYNDLIIFFKKHNLYEEKMFNYIRNNSIIFDYKDDETRKKIGCYKVVQNNSLSSITIVTPIIEDERTLIININIYMQAILAYQNLGYIYNPTEEQQINDSAIAMLYENIYLLENSSEVAKKYIDKLNQNIINSNDEKYKIALNIQEKLIENYLKKKNKNQNLINSSKKILKRSKQKENKDTVILKLCK